jgi:hypothetical protein
MVVSNVNVPEATDLDDFLVQPEHWLKSWWRPLMAIQYMVVCLFDFIVGPILTMAYYGLASKAYVPWVPMTIQGGGLYHLSMGAVVGVTAWTRSTEKQQVFGAIESRERVSEHPVGPRHSHPSEPPEPRFPDDK